jgi:hypothetical protein
MAAKINTATPALAIAVLSSPCVLASLLGFAWPPWLARSANLSSESV